MPTTDTRIDAYIEKKADFAKPILKHIRELVHKACPGVQETIKWGMPYFDYEGSVLCAMAAFKEHCTFLFWKASLMKDPEKIFQITEREAMGHFGRITSLKDLPSDKILIAYIKEAAKLNEEDIKLPPRKKPVLSKEPETPNYFSAALKKNKKARVVFDNFPHGKKKEYIEWLTEAKTEATRNKRLETAVEWIAEGKSRNWKYEKC
jgi:uncharacterized protein YdeI (YjbR/CyaY-like superfamily)